MSRNRPKARVRLRSVRPPANLKTIAILLAGGSAVLLATLALYIAYTKLAVADGEPTGWATLLGYGLVIMFPASFFGLGAVVLGLAKLIGRRLRSGGVTRPKRSVKPASARKG